MESRKLTFYKCVRYSLFVFTFRPNIKNEWEVNYADRIWVFELMNFPAKNIEKRLYWRSKH